MIKKKINNIEVILNNTDKFHDNVISIYFRQPLTKKNITGGFLIEQILTKSNLEYKTNRELNIALKKAYGTKVRANAFTVGNYGVMKVNVRWLNDLADNYGLLESSVKLLASFFNEPNVKNGKWNKKVFDSAKSQVKNNIVTLKEQTGLYAMNQASQMLGSGTVFANSMNGDLDMLEEFNSENIVDVFNEMLNETEMVIVGNGYFDEEEFFASIKNNFSNLKSVKQTETLLFENVKYRAKIKKKIEESDVEQTKVVVGFKIKPMTKYESLYVLPILNHVLGSPLGDSKLWVKIREEKGLAYSVHSVADGPRHNLMAYAGIDAKNIDEVIELCELSLEELQAGDFLQKEIESARTIMLNRIDKINDDLNLANVNDFIKYLRGIGDDRDKKDSFKSVTKEDIIKLAKKIIPDSAFVLKGGQNEEIN